MNATCRFLVGLIGIGSLVNAPPARAQMFFGKDPASSLTRNNPIFLKAFKEVIAKPSESTVRVLSDGKDTALGMIVGPDGWILTKANDLKGDIRVKLRDGRTHEASLVGVHQQHDVALLKIDATGLKPVEFTESKQVGVGNWLACVGTGEEPVAVGVVSVATRTIPKGAFSFPTIDLSKAGFLGVQLEEGEGHPRIMDVVPDKPAAKIGLKKKDLLLSVNGTEMKNVEQFQREVAKYKAGDVITLKVRRGDMEMEMRPTLERRPPDSNRGELQNRMGSELSSRRAGYSTILQHDSVVKPTDCGGPIVDLQGRVVGINICRAGRTESWAVPSETLQPLLFDLMSGRLAPKSDVRKSSIEQQLADARKALRKAEDARAQSEKKLADLKAMVARLEVEQKKAEAIAKSTPAKPDASAPAAGLSDDGPAVADRVVGLMLQRLNLMKDVAGAKWLTKQTEADPQREKDLIDQLVARGEKMGVPAQTVRGFFAAQFDAAKQVQKSYFERFQKDKVELKNVPDLQKDLRPKLDQVSDDLLIALSQLQPHLANPAVQKRLRDRAAAVLTGEGISDAIRNRALEPLVKR